MHRGGHKRVSTPCKWVSSSSRSSCYSWASTRHWAWSPQWRWEPPAEQHFLIKVAKTKKANYKTLNRKIFKKIKWPEHIKPTSCFEAGRDLRALPFGNDCFRAKLRIFQLCFLETKTFSTFSNFFVFPPPAKLREFGAEARVSKSADRNTAEERKEPKKHEISLRKRPFFGESKFTASRACFEILCWQNSNQRYN